MTVGPSNNSEEIQRMLSCVIDESREQNRQLRRQTELLEELLQRQRALPGRAGRTRSAALGEDFLSAAEAGEILGYSARWVNEHKHLFPGAQRIDATRHNSPWQYPREAVLRERRNRQVGVSGEQSSMPVPEYLRRARGLNRPAQGLGVDEHCATLADETDPTS